METLYFEEGANRQIVGVSMEAKVFIVSPCKGAKPFYLEENKFNTILEKISN